MLESGAAAALEHAALTARNGPAMHGLVSQALWRQVRMPRYFFPSWDADSFVPDDQGLELEGLEQACALARIALAEIARDLLAGLAGDRVMRIQVLDEDRRVLAELRLTFDVDGERPVSTRVDPADG